MLRSARSSWIGLLGWMIAALATGAVGAIASVDAADFYALLAKPTWAPPAAVFGPVWSVLYVLMGVAAWLVWRSAGRTRIALTSFVLQLAANALWSWLFFGWHHGGLAAMDVVVLLLLIAAMLALFWRVSRLAALLIVPYLLWVAFATALTLTIWRANPGML